MITVPTSFCLCYLHLPSHEPPVKVYNNGHLALNWVKPCAPVRRFRPRPLRRHVGGPLFRSRVSPRNVCCSRHRLNKLQVELGIGERMSSWKTYGIAATMLLGT